LTRPTWYAILSRMLIKVRKLGPTFGAPAVKEKGGLLVMEAEALGELVKVPECHREEGELMVGELSMTFFPVGIEVQLDGEHAKLNGLWVQRGIYNALLAKAAAA
jgi:hypothetical protein